MSSVDDLLRRAGWRPGRRVHIARHVESLKAEGYRLTPSLEDFLREFAGLRIDYPHPTLDSERCLLAVNPSAATSTLFREHVEEYSESIEEELVPIGEDKELGMYALLSESGCLYFGMDESLLRIGDSWHEGLALLLRRGIPAKIS